MIDEFLKKSSAHRSSHQPVTTQNGAVTIVQCLPVDEDGEQAEEARALY
jgi:hypothetical protein